MDPIYEYFARFLFGFFAGIFLGMGLQVSFPPILYCGFAGAVITISTCQWPK